jgi:4-amino-4-deoxy-L-arabinose transferase-like glycosyltransferase
VGGPGWPGVGLAWAGGLVAALYVHFGGRTPSGHLELGLVLALSVAVIGAGASLLGSRCRPATLAALGIAGLLAVAAFSGALPAWLAAVAVPFLAAGPGLLLGRQLLPRPAPVLLVLALGLAALSQAGFVALVVVGGVEPVVLVAGCVVAWGVALTQRALRPPAKAPPTSLSAPERVLLGALLALVAMLLLAASVPACCFDAVWYHLPVAEAIAEGRYVVMPDLWWTRIPLAYHVLAALAHALGGGVASALLHGVFLALTAAWAGWLGTRLAGRLAGLVAILLFLTIPLVMWEGIVANADLAAAFFGAAGVGAALEFLRDRRPGWLVTAGLLIGTAAGVKSFAAALLLPIAWLLVREHRRGTAGPEFWRGAALLAIGFLLTAGPWLVRTAVLTGNPVFPAFTVNPGAEGLPGGSAIRTYPWTLGRLLAFPYLLTFNASALAEVPPGSMGTFPLLWLPLVAGRWRQLGQVEKDLLLVAGAYAVAVGVFEPSPRFLLPAWLLVVVVVGSALVAGGPALRGLPARVFAGVVLLGALGYSMVAWLSFLPVAASLDYVTGRLDRRAFLQRTVPGFDVFDDVRRLVPPGARVLAAGTYATWHVGRPILPAFLPAVRPLFADPGLSREAALGLLRERGIRYFLAPSSSRFRLIDLGLVTPLASDGGFTLYAVYP